MPDEVEGLFGGWGARTQKLGVGVGGSERQRSGWRLRTMELRADVSMYVKTIFERRAIL